MAGTIDKGFLREQAALHGITLDDAALERFDLVARMMLDWNTKINLTTITQPRDVVLKHFIDSMVAALLLPEEASLIDVGTGAGYSGIPLAIVRPDIRLTLLDSLNKRLVYLKELCSALELPAGLVHARAEDAGQDKEHREGYDVAAARAVAPLPVLCEYCLPLVRRGGIFIALKGREGEIEAAEAERTAEVLGGRLSGIEKRQIYDGGEIMERRLVVFEKSAPTPPKYPRNSAKIKKQPIK